MLPVSYQDLAKIAIHSELFNLAEPDTVDGPQSKVPRISDGVLLRCGRSRVSDIGGTLVSSDHHQQSRAGVPVRGVRAWPTSMFVVTTLRMRNTGYT